MGMPEVGMP